MLTSQGVKAIIRPPRQKYSLSALPQQVEVPGFGKVLRINFAVETKRGFHMYASLYQAPEPHKPASCLFYLHGNASNQLEGRFAVSYFVPLGIHVCCFDFVGCGESEGDYVTLGHFEVQDTKTLIEQVCEIFEIKKFAIWGRSMGAVTAILYASRFKNAEAFVADSAFSSLTDICRTVSKSKYIPEPLFNAMMPSIRQQILIQTHFDINSLDILSAVKEVTCPAYFIHGRSDDFINPMNSQLLHSLCKSDQKILRIVEGGHNTDRPVDIILNATEFIALHLGVEVEFEMPTEPQTVKQGSSQHFSSVNDMLAHM